jgi:hypothetical protein
MAFRGFASLQLLCMVALISAPLPGRSADLPPRYSSQDDVERAHLAYGAPEDNARPGEIFFRKGAYAYIKQDYAFAVDMYKVAASWAYKPAEYNLAVMYLKGDGVPINRPLAMAWMALAAERDDQDYVQARELIYADLSKTEFARANEIWRGLKKTYGDQVALSRAKARWADVRNNVTGSHVGSIGHLLVGGHGPSATPANVNSMGAPVPGPFSTEPFGLVGGGNVDGSIAYRQLHESTNPYDPKFEWRTSPNPKGTTSVGALIPVEAKNGENRSGQGSTDPQHPDFF